MANLVTVARQHGSQGEIVAQEIARLLEAIYLDKELIGLAAQRAGVAESAMAERDERHITRSERFLRLMVESFALSIGTDSSAVDLLLQYETAPPSSNGEDGKRYSKRRADLMVDERRYLALITGVLKSIAQAGNAVVMGRGGNIILKDIPGVLRVFVVAPLEIRVRRVMEQEGVDAQEAARRIHRVDTNRAAFIKQLVKAEWDDPANYDLVVNTGRGTVGYIAQLIADAARDWPASLGSKTA